ncbi:hypothetical protein LELG_01255 [Lodderomyces elongisporus NRRL YB-4239]|uniref:DNA-directed RNA polymerase I 49 kDa polypeptide n=1 Tax=Lodderomyces elongisporus (strain ATCC 11503 / CBS 2605 / JCM 1781 / NBRC 1676 / NRRL YB-4239) TaxID=379508 RepID=A5DV69_LODEL|nr:hypothetical protein LELG_01255 [Lodderomyces elongisporus NRRL YB-4239]
MTSSSHIKVSAYSEEPVACVGSSFNGLSVPESANFEVYKHKKNGSYLLHGESETLDYEGKSSEENDYLIAVYDPNKKSVELYKSPYISTRVTSKKHKVYKGPAIKSTGLKNVAQRKALGEAFGTKKAKQALTNLEKNRIDADRLQDAEFDIVDTVQEGAAPVKVEEVTGPAPQPNVNATNVEDVYPLDNIIPQKFWNYIRVQLLLIDPKPLDSFPSQPSFVSSLLPRLIKNKDVEKLQLLYYASLLAGVYENRRVSEKQALLTRLQNKPSETLIDGILDQFAVSRSTKVGKSKDKAFFIDPQNEDKLLCYLFIALLHLFNFSVELNPLAKDLKLKPLKLVGLFRALGAIIKSATVAEAEAYGIPKSAAGTYKIATLKVPFKMPEMVRRAKRR